MASQGTRFQVVPFQCRITALKGESECGAAETNADHPLALPT